MMTVPTQTDSHEVGVESYTRPTDLSEKEISMLWTPGHNLTEMIHLPGEGLKFATKEGREPIQIADTVQGLTPLGWAEPFAKSGTVRLPSGVAPYGSLTHLAAAIREFIHSHFECDEIFESIAVLYVLHTWVHERFQAVPYLRFLGMSGSGKTRATETIGALCYRALTISGSATAPVMFRMIEAFGGTLLMDEADFERSQVGSDIAKILNCGYAKGSPVIRNDQAPNGKFIPRMYQVFGPKIINGRRPFKDDATESRCLSHTPKPAERPEVPRQLPEDFEAQARALRNMALQWRFDELDRFPLRDVRMDSVRPRTNQILAPLVMVAERLGDARFLRDLQTYAARLDVQAAEEGRSTVEASLISAYVSSSSRRPTCKELVGSVLASDGPEDPKLRLWLTPKRASSMLKNLGFETRHGNKGAVVEIDPTRLRALCKRFGIVTSASPQPSLPSEGGDLLVTMAEPFVTCSTNTIQ